MSKGSNRIAARAKPRTSAWADSCFVLVTGCWIALSLIKFGNPVIFEEMLSAPRNFIEFVFTPWPIGWGYALLAAALLTGFRFFRPVFGKPYWPIGALGFWLGWQFLSSTQSIDPKLSTPTLVHFCSCVVSLLIGWWALGRRQNLRLFWIPVLFGFLYLLIAGFDQQYGGLEATREAFYAQQNWQLYSKEFLLKMQSPRIFATLVYPNAFAGVILLVAPVAVWKLWRLTEAWPRLARLVTSGLLAYLAASCLYWTGSKGGWLVGLFMGLVFILHLRLKRKWKVAILTASLAIGLAAFFVRFSGYFQKGATSVSARFTYWQAAVQATKENPILGTGPGTYAVAYRRIKPPDAEMAKLTHNDYLEQASDSGLPAAIAFISFVFGSLVVLYRQRPANNWTFLLIWLGLLGWAAQAFIEFALYIPAIAWVAFLFLGLLWSERENRGISDDG